MDYPETEVKAPWELQLATDKLTLTLTFDQWCDVIGSLFSFTVDRSRTEIKTFINNQEDPVDLDSLLRTTQELDKQLHEYRDKVMPHWKDFL
jgi:hypothetical protein